MHSFSENNHEALVLNHCSVYIVSEQYLHEDQISYQFDYYDEQDIFSEAGLDYDELEFMDPEERREVLEDAGLDPDEFDF